MDRPWLEKTVSCPRASSDGVRCGDSVQTIWILLDHRGDGVVRTIADLLDCRLTGRCHSTGQGGVHAADLSSSDARHRIAVEGIASPFGIHCAVYGVLLSEGKCKVRKNGFFLYARERCT